MLWNNYESYIQYEQVTFVKRHIPNEKSIEKVLYNEKNIPNEKSTVQWKKYSKPNEKSTVQWKKYSKRKKWKIIFHSYHKMKKGVKINKKMNRW